MLKISLLKWFKKFLKFDLAQNNLYTMLFFLMKSLLLSMNFNVTLIMLLLTIILSNKKIFYCIY